MPEREAPSLLPTCAAKAPCSAKTHALGGGILPRLHAHRISWFSLGSKIGAFKAGHRLHPTVTIGALIDWTPLAKTS